MNVAVTVVAAAKDTVHVAAVPEHAPDHCPNAKPVLGVAVSVTLVPLLKVAAQVGPQLIPAGVLVTVPVPEPFSATVNCAEVGGGGGGGGGVKLCLRP